MINVLRMLCIELIVMHIIRKDFSLLDISGNQSRVSGIKKILWQGTRPRSGRKILAHGLQPR